MKSLTVDMINLNQNKLSSQKKENKFKDTDIKISFDKKLKEKTNENQKTSGNKTTKENCLLKKEKVKNEEKSVDSNVKSESNNTVLKEGTVSDDENSQVTNRDNLKKLVNCLMDILNGDNSDDKLKEMKDLLDSENLKLKDILSLLLYGSLIQNNKVDTSIDKNQLEKKLLQVFNMKDNKQLTSLLNSFKDKSVNLNENTDKLNEIMNMLNQNLESEDNDFIQSIKKVLSVKLKENETNDVKIDLKGNVGNKEKGKNIIPILKNEKHTESNLNNKEEDMLKNLISDGQKSHKNSKIDSKINRVTNFMSKFNSVNEVTNTSEVSNIVVNKNNMVLDVVKTVKFMELNNLKDLTVKVAPKELGEIVVKLTMESGRMRLALNASNKDTFNILNSNLQDISDKLNSNNIKIQPAEINIYNEDTTFFSNQFGGQSSEENSQNNNSRSKVNEVSNTRLDNDEEILDKSSYDESNVNALA
ncbi:flagellar hook-length control protein FliK [Haloimpatiens sp. FM7330]|uniref:flagellar hook-length control protein FliK n=1 Tax=Haloimpatiens sp. FM7330 TaxID=3298610 RepID=UPI00363DB752